VAARLESVKVWMLHTSSIPQLGLWRGPGMINGAAMLPASWSPVQQVQWPGPPILQGLKFVRPWVLYQETATIAAADGACAAGDVVIVMADPYTYGVGFGDFDGIAVLQFSTVHVP
jgi:hypothetical protein